MLRVVGIGPGGIDDMTGAAMKALKESDIIVGYTVYVDLVKPFLQEKEFYTTGMTQEVMRCEWALERAKEGKEISVVCSGDSGVYGMASLIFELANNYQPVEICVVAGITAALSGGAVLGAPLTHDFAVISLSDRLTPYELIMKRLRLAAEGDFAIAIYNPGGKNRADYLQKACDELMKVMPKDRICGYVKNIGRDGQESHILTLEKLRDTQVDMFTTVFIGNSMTKESMGKMITPRGYHIHA